MNRLSVIVCLSLCLSACSSKQAADFLIYNATIYTVDSAFPVAEAMVVKDGKIVAVGNSEQLMERYEAKEKLDANGKFIYPGLIDAHAHFYGYAMTLQRADLVGTKSWEEVIDRVSAFNETNRDGWVLGRGWDQNDWEEKTFPNKEKLDSLFPDRPVLLQRVDGHAAIANQAALNSAGLKAGDAIAGGIIEQKDGRLTGLLIDNAVDLVTAKIPPPSAALISKAFLKAQQNCFAAGLTTIADCGLDHEQVSLIDSLHKSGLLKIQLYVMLSDLKKNYDYLFAKGKIKTERLNVRAFKIYADGSLGSRGACLLEPYSDKPGHSGFLLSQQAHFDSVAKMIYDKGFQMCTHAIGDSGNRTMLNIYAKYLKGKNDLRWRIEHAQVVNERDFELFGRYNIIPSVQPTHATSDMYWAVDRIGKERAEGAYAYKRLMLENGWLPLGTDFPVEDISPLKTFYAAVFRKDKAGYPEGGFQANNALSREEALKGMTIWAARACFEEGEKGSLEAGKAADFIVLDEDLMKAGEQGILDMKVTSTYVKGEQVYGRE
jgi:predicted amidohydrolase YtcJ